jgi:preprotein translocase subunit SecD
MEIRLLALNGAVPSNGIGAQVDVFQKADVSSYIANGDAPIGWKWFPVANGVEAEVTGSAPAGSENPYITRTSNGQLFLLTADRPDMTLTHASDVRPWGVESVMVENDEQAPGVVIHLDQAGGDLMHEFTQKYLGHRIAVVVGGQICEVALIQSPVRSAIEVRLPAGQLAQAEGLRDSLMK